MDRQRLAELLRDGKHDEAAALIESYTIPQVTSLERDFVMHDLSPETSLMMSGSFEPIGARVVIEVDSGLAILGMSRGGLLFYIGQPDEPGGALYDAGAKPLEGVGWHTVATVGGETAWAQSAHRRIVMEVDPNKPVSWAILGGIFGGVVTTEVADAPERLVITPDGTKGFVTSPGTGTVTPISLGRPGYSFDHRLPSMDVPSEPVPPGAGAYWIAT